MTKWFEHETNFRWAMMVGLGELWRLHWAPIREDLIYDFLQGIKSINEIQIKAVVRGQKVKVTYEMISKMQLLPC